MQVISLEESLRRQGNNGAAEEVAQLRLKATRWDALETLMIVGDVELTQAENGGYSIFVEPVENILPQSWESNDPCQVVDKVVAQLAAASKP